MSIHRRRAIASISQESDLTDYVCFCANEDNSSVRIELQNESGSKKILEQGYPNIEYSRNKRNWFPLEYNSTEAVVLDHAGDKIFLRGNNPNGLTVFDDSGSAIGFSVFKITGSVAGSGNIQTLLDKTGEQTSAPYMAFTYLFRKCKNITTSPKLCATTLYRLCYFSMFIESSLVEAPDLPALTLAERCYSQMFMKCDNLTTAGKMLAQVLATSCCEQMYSFCSALVTLPKLYSLNTLSNAYLAIFNNCTSISMRVAPDETHQIEYRVPFEGSGTGSIQGDLFYGTDSDLPSQTRINTTYYTSNELV